MLSRVVALLYTAIYFLLDMGQWLQKLKKSLSGSYDFLKPDFFFSYFFSSFLAEPAWLHIFDARNVAFIFFLVQEIATANLHKTSLIFHFEVLVFALLKKTGAYHIRHLGKLF